MPRKLRPVLTSRLARSRWPSPIPHPPCARDHPNRTNETAQLPPPNATHPPQPHDRPVRWFARASRSHERARASGGMGWDGIMGGAAQHSAADRFASASTSDVAAAFATPEIRVRRVGGWARTRFSAPVHITGYVQLARRNGTATGRGSWLPAADACMCRPTSNDELNRKFVLLLMLRVLCSFRFLLLHRSSKFSRKCLRAQSRQ